MVLASVCLHAVLSQPPLRKPAARGADMALSCALLHVVLEVRGEMCEPVRNENKADAAQPLGVALTPMLSLGFRGLLSSQRCVWGF